jgi:ribosomal protein S18 acetylase RimI-like enzyme
MDESEVIARTDANYQHVYALLATGHDGGEVREKDGLVVINTGTPAAVFNNAIVTRALSAPEKLLREAIEYFDACGTPFVVRIREGLDVGAERACEALGMPYSDTVPGMALAPITAASSAPVAGLEIRTARTRAEFDEFFDVVCSVFEFPAELARVIFSDELLHRNDSEWYIGYVDGAPVATSTLVMTDRTAGIFNVATESAYRGRGIGEAMTRKCVRRGAEMGCVMAALQASEMGRPVYERMGFRLVSPYRTFHRPGV